MLKKLVSQKCIRVDLELKRDSFNFVVLLSLLCFSSLMQYFLICCYKMSCLSTEVFGSVEAKFLVLVINLSFSGKNELKYT